MGLAPIQRRVTYLVSAVLIWTTVASQRKDNFCARRKDGLIYPDSEDCRAYVYCSGGIAYRSQCLAGLYYEPSLQACEFDNTGKCYENEGRRKPPPPSRSPLPPIGGFVNNFLPKLPSPERGPTVALDYEKHFDARQFCSGRPDGTYSHPTICTGYLLCSNHLPFEALCPDNLVYSDVTGGCDYDYIGICSNSVKRFQPSPTYNRPFKSITLTKDLSRRLAQLMPRAIESALVHLTRTLQREAELAATFSEPFEESFGKHKRRDRPFKLVQRFLKAKPLAKQLSMTAFVIHNASEYITEKLSMKMKDTMQILDTIPSPIPASNIRLAADAPFPEPQPGTCPWPSYDCRLSGKYRSFDGSCNNVQHPLWGRAFIPLKRQLPPVYQDGQEKFRVSASGSPLPSARQVSVSISEDADHPHHIYTLIGAMQWGQFMDHDLDLTAISTIATEPTGYGKTMDIECGSDGCDNSLFECEPIRVPDTDHVFTAHSNKCLEFVRSEDTPNLDCKMGAREQLNQITSYLDASQVYGSTKEEADHLRDLAQTDRGKLKITLHPYAPSLKALLPQRLSGEDCEDFDSERRCFKAGDERVNEQMGLTVMHTMWMREHNRIEEELHRVNPHWGGETLYQETRRVVGAMMQHITFSEFLPIVLGPKQLKLFGLELLTNGYFTGYDYTVDASTSNVFATAAFRFGHSLLQPWIQRADHNYNTSVYSAMNLSSILNRPKSVYDLGNGGIDGFIRGLSCQPIQNFDRHVTKQLTAHLFTEAPPTGVGNDLVSLNIQRGRDHGLPGYNAWREWCGLRKASNFDDMMDIKETRVRLKFKQMYESVDDVDLFPAGISERPVEGGLVGPTFSCIIARQFQSLRKGDRFWYENDGAFRFTPGQIKELRKVSLAKVLCNNGDQIDTIQPRVMERPFREVHPTKSLHNYNPEFTGLSKEWFVRLWDSDYNARVNCSCIDDIDFNAWKSS